MIIEEQFNLIAEEYDAKRRFFIPCFDEYYEATTNFITKNISTPKRVLDLGTGTGLLTYYWYKKFNSTEYTLVDIADEMLNIAKKRFSNIENIKFEIADYREGLPKEEFDCIISALSIHHLENEEKKNLFLNIYNKLPVGCVFVNYDQFCGGSVLMDNWYDADWVTKLENSSLSPEDIKKWKERRKLDKEISVETELKMLSDCGFSEVKCVYSNQKFAVIIAIK